MIHSIAEFSLSDQIIQSNNFNQEDDHDNIYQMLPDNLKHVSEKNMLLPAHCSEDEALNLEEMRKIFKEQHPWSVSDPFPQSFKPEFSPRECKSLPNLQPGVERKHRHFASFSIQKTIVSSMLRNKTIFKWVIIVLNVFIELSQVTLTQEASQGKIRHEIYLKMSIIASSICLMMSIIEILHEGKSKGVIWVQKGYYCCWCYYPGMDGELFGNFALYFGLISSIIQLIVNVTQKFSRSIIKFDYLPLLLSVCYFIAAIIGSRKKTSKGIIRCKFHGYNAVEGVLIDGHDSWVYECPEC